MCGNSHFLCLYNFPSPKYCLYLLSMADKKHSCESNLSPAEIALSCGYCFSNPQSTKYETSPARQVHWDHKERRRDVHE